MPNSLSTKPWHGVPRGQICPSPGSRENGPIARRDMLARSGHLPHPSRRPTLRALAAHLAAGGAEASRLHFDAFGS